MRRARSDRWLKRHGFTNGLWRLEERDRAREQAAARRAPLLDPSKTKLDCLKEAAARGDWLGALRIAARFADLGEHKAAIMRAHEAVQRPAFQRQLGRDPERLLAEGLAALKARYRLD